MPEPPEAPRCLVVGGARGLGAAIVERIVADGGRCHATARAAPSAARSAPVTWSSCDVRVPADVDRAVAEAIAAMERVDALVYCAGTAAVGPVEDLTPALWDEVHEVNVRGFGLAIRAALPHWRSQGSGCAVALSSQAARRGQAMIGAYSASKAAIDGLVRALAVELAPVVRVNAVAPGIVPTDMILEDFARQARLGGTSVEAVRRRTLERIPLGRMQPAGAVAAAVAFLVSAGARDVTGHILAVDGGMSA